MEIIKGGSVTQVTTKFTHFHDVKVDGALYHRHHAITNIKYPSDPHFKTTQKVTWSQVILDGLNKGCSRNLTSKEVGALGLEDAFLKEKPEFKI